MGRHRGARRGAPVRTGLLGVSAAVAVGAIAVASGLLPGGDTFTLESASPGGEQRVATQQAPSLTTQGGASATATGGAASRSAGNGKAATPSKAPAPPKPTPTPTKAAATPSPKPPAPKPTPTPTPTRTAHPTPDPTTEAPEPEATVRTLVSREAAAEAEVVRLVNAERAKVGCVAVRSDADLAALAGAFSADMAARDFFDHTNPDGLTPWARAEKAGVSNLGAENIARGQVDAVAVMKSWMASDGHRANILNCDYKTLGVGVHFADGGPWWTQDFGF